MLNGKKIEVLGDSIMKGVLLDNNRKRYVCDKNDIVKNFAKMFRFDIINRSKFGSTVLKGEKLLENTVNNGKSCDIVLLEYGGNDCDFKWEEISQDPDRDHQPATPLGIFHQTLCDMVKKIQKLDIKAVLMSLPPIEPKKYFEWFTKKGLNRENILKWLIDIDTIYRYQEMYSLAITGVAMETGCCYVDVRSVFLEKKDYTEYLCDDGIHPNQKGRQLILEVFTEFAKNKGFRVVPAI